MRTITQDNARLYAVIRDAKDARDAAAKAEKSAYAREVEAWLDSPQYKATDIAMRTNRAVGF